MLTSAETFAARRRSSAGSKSRPRVLDDLLVAAVPPGTARCMHPECSELCTWPTSGKPALFHHRRCLERYDRDRSRLLEEVQSIEAAVRLEPASSRNGRQLRRHLARRRWHLARYPRLD